MSDEAAVETEVEPEQEPEQTTEQPSEERSGHISKDAWIAKGRDPDKWRSEEEFEEAGPLMRQIDRLKHDAERQRQETTRINQDHEDQIRSLNQLHTIQSKNLIKDLETRRNLAIDEADSPQAAILQDQIDETRRAQTISESRTQQPANPPQPAKSASVLAWEAQNPWIMNTADPKTPYASQQFQLYQNQGHSTEQALTMVDNDLARAFPNINHARNTTALAEGTKSSAPTKGKSSSVTWDELTANEMITWNTIYEGEDIMTKNDFLKAVANDRKGA